MLRRSSIAWRQGLATPSDRLFHQSPPSLPCIINPLLNPTILSPVRPCSSQPQKACKFVKIVNIKLQQLKIEITMVIQAEGAKSKCQGVALNEHTLKRIREHTSCATVFSRVRTSSGQTAYFLFRPEHSLATN